jgi:hypothetical protein
VVQVVAPQGAVVHVAVRSYAHPKFVAIVF